MSLTLAILWPGLAVALALGLAVGGLIGLPRSRGSLGAAVALALALAALAGIAVLAALPGRPGLWAEIAALVGAAYGAGCGLGGIGRRLAGRSP
ncbi:hypothetical protein [Methylobacterium sp. Leaf118]|uniref:hypothetical protein n=1 Tax=Methylobacterium sp. Leaf118 TaxID=2876562 RepID=UPI001E52BC4B|nr:hypothetical protein [Methylobacterium sp. Leaf118]